MLSVQAVREENSAAPHLIPDPHVSAQTYLADIISQQGNSIPISAVPNVLHSHSVEVVLHVSICAYIPGTKSAKALHSRSV
jgi:hypothetical protein